jgi:hypothetical protein
MTFVLGNVGRVLANERAVSCTLAGWNMSHTRAMGEVTTLCDSGNKFVPGLMSGSLVLRGPQDSTGQDLHGEITAAMGVDNSLLVTACPNGTTIGQFAMTVLGDPSEHTIDATVSDAVGFTLTAQADESVDMGFIVHALGAETADGNGTTVDRGVGSTTTGGGVAVIHATAYSGLTGAIIKVQHSTDGSTWADLVTFTNITAISAERKFLVAGTTINRYVRAVTDVTGTGSVTFLVAFAPR